MNAKTLDKYELDMSKYEDLISQFEQMLTINPKNDLTKKGKDILQVNNINPNVESISFDDWNDYVQAYEKFSKESLTNKEVYTPEYLSRLFSQETTKGIEDIANNLFSKKN